MLTTTNTVIPPCYASHLCMACLNNSLKEREPDANSATRQGHHFGGIQNGHTLTGVGIKYKKGQGIRQIKVSNISL